MSKREAKRIAKLAYLAMVAEYIRTHQLELPI